MAEVKLDLSLDSACNTTKKLINFGETNHELTLVLIMILSHQESKDIVKVLFGVLDVENDVVNKAITIIQGKLYVLFTGILK